MDIERQTRKEIDLVSKFSGYGSLSSSITENIRAISINQEGKPVPKNKENHGYTFFTRPDLNLSYDNLIANRMLTPLTSEDRNSLARAIRATLDPTWESQGTGRQDHSLRSALTDPRQAFIPLLTNNLISLSGWPDITVPTYTSTEGEYKESYSMADGTSNIYNTYDITANFRNMQGDPITLLFAIWCRYMTLVYEDVATPYPKNLFNNRIDYQTRIYRLVMDPRNEYVQKIGACGAAFPTASALGSAFNFSQENTYSEDADQISVPFRCVGADYMDPISVREFNAIVSYHNVGMRDGNRSSRMRRISRQDTYSGYGDIGHRLQNVLSHKLFPRINPNTMALEWWADQAAFDDAIQQLVSKGLI